MDYRIIINSAVWLLRPVVYGTFLLCQPQHQIPWQESVEMCVFSCACEFLCVWKQLRAKVAALKAWLIQFYTVSHFISWSKVIGHRVYRQT